LPTNLSFENFEFSTRRERGEEQEREVEEDANETVSPGLKEQLVITSSVESAEMIVYANPEPDEREKEMLSNVRLPLVDRRESGGVVNGGRTMLRKENCELYVAIIEVRDEMEGLKVSVGISERENRPILVPEASKTALSTAM
jgi:hypothetical protein